MVNRKVITAIINGCLYIDPSDVERVDIEIIKEKAKKTCSQPLEVRIAPINEWMPKSGTEAIMKEAMEQFSKPLTARPSNVMDYMPIMSRNAIRKAKKNRKYEKRYF